MARVLRCRGVGVDCDFFARGATTKEVLEKAKDHACSDHGIRSIPPELADEVVAAIRDEGAATA